MSIVKGVFQKSGFNFLDVEVDREQQAGAGKVWVKDAGGDVAEIALHGHFGIVGEQIVDRAVVGGLGGRSRVPFHQLQIGDQVSVALRSSVRATLSSDRR